jgi:CubicO group peptidase (beta-lactamase class C family)
MIRSAAALGAALLLPMALPLCSDGSARDANRLPVTWSTLDREPRDGEAARRRLADLMAEHHLGATSVAVVQDDGVVFTAVLGEITRGRAADERTVFRAASLSKPVFAYLVLKLVDEGILDLDSPVDTFLPRPLAAYEHYRNLAADPRHEALTARRLLSQQSGLPNWHRGGPVPFIADPGTRFGYSGEGYALLQLVVEERTGRTVNDLAQAKVFGPLEMAHSSFIWERRFDADFAVDLDSGLGPLIRQSRQRANVAGSLITNAEDYARFLQAILTGRGLTPSTHAQMIEPQVQISSRSLFSPPDTDTGAARAMQLTWALGWGRFVSGHGPALFHLGREEGCEGYAVAFLEARTAFVVMAVNSLENTFTAPLAAALIGDTESPLDWLEFGRTGEAATRWRTLIAGTAVTLLGVLAVFLGLRYKQRKR